MFTGTVLWRGIIYTLLMIFGKMACGLWLIRFTVSIPREIHPRRLRRFLPISTSHFWGRKIQDASGIDQPSTQLVELPDHVSNATTKQTQRNQNLSTAVLNDETQSISSTPDAVNDSTNTAEQHVSKSPSKPLSLYPASILAFAMVSRGEIGFLISSLADSNAIFASDGNDDIFLIVTWAIVLCTVVGPVGVGLLVKRLKRLKRTKEQGGGGRDVLGVWGVQ